MNLIRFALGAIPTIILISACGGGLDEGENGTSRLGESCASRSDCIKGLTCVNQICVIDERTDRSCSEIESIYLAATQTPEAKGCSMSSDCVTVEGLCNAPDDRVGSSQFLNLAFETDLSMLVDEWETNGCDQGMKCADGLLGGAWCIQGSCQSGGTCDRALDELCSVGAGYNCDLFEGSSFRCREQLQDLVTCDPEGGDTSGMYSCLYEASPSCSSVEEFLHGALAICGDKLGMEPKGGLDPCLAMGSIVQAHWTGFCAGEDDNCCDCNCHNQGKVRDHDDNASCTCVDAGEPVECTAEEKQTAGECLADAECMDLAKSTKKQMCQIEWLSEPCTWDSDCPYDMVCHTTYQTCMLP